MNMRNVWIAIIVILVAGGVLWITAGSKGNTPVAQVVNPTPKESVTPVETASPSAAVKEINVKGSEFAFDPAAITLTQGERVKVTFENVGKFPHNLAIPKLNITTKTIQPNQSDTIEFIVDKTGTFDMVCTVDAHEQKGMKGTLTIQ